MVILISNFFPPVIRILNMVPAPYRARFITLKINLTQASPDNTFFKQELTLHLQ